MSPVSAAEHNELHAKVGLGLPTNLVDGNSGHLAHHELIHSATDLGLDLDLTLGEPGHLAASTALAAWLDDSTPGIRGTAGPRASSAIPGFPTGATGYSTFSALQTAVNAAGTGRKFRITASMAFTAPLIPHANDEFWGEFGVSITASGAVDRFFDGRNTVSTADNVRIMNLSMSGFVNRAVHAGTNDGTNGWEVAYCMIDGLTTSIGGTGGHWIHHNIIKNIGFESGLATYLGVDVVIEDNEYGPCPNGGGNKAVATTRTKVRHNRFFGQGATGVPYLQGAGMWFDYSNKDIIFEWNVSENNNGAGVAFEANHWDDATGLPGVFTNIVRYNRFQNNGDGGVLIASSSFTEVYENTLIGNCVYAGSGEFALSLIKASQDPRPAPGQGGELRANHIFRNHITPGSNKRGAQLDVQDTVVGYDDYVTNVKDNTWSYNDYNFVDPNGTNLFRREGTNLSWAQWRAGNVPAGAGAQDANSTIS